MNRGWATDWLATWSMVRTEASGRSGSTDRSVARTEGTRASGVALRMTIARSPTGHWSCSR